ncbi:Glu-tRNA(Gln) amidotransferase subunit GatE [Elusimicrobiota bacterium]
MRYIPLGKATDKLYKRMGLMSGLEIHQQLAVEKKLFCRCPAGHYSKRWDAKILRHMRPTLSELGEYDPTALMEFKTKKEISYLINKDTVCTYEFDDTPPFEINEEALDIALKITLLLKCSLVSELHIARKQYLDGSIPAGFQRTTILGINGWIPYDGRRIGIRQLAVEEDSCREMSDTGHLRTYATDRLGIPLIETVTEPDMKTPHAVAGVAQVLRRLVRATGSVRTGVGAARQDVNVSVRGGNRCEIKGVSSIKRIPLLVHNEAFRQSGLLEIRARLRKRGLKAKGLSFQDADVTDRLKVTRFTPIRNAIDEGMKVYGVRLDNYEGMLRFPLLPGRTFLHEISDRVRVIACIDSQPNVISSDSPEGTLSAHNWNIIRKTLKAKDKDAVVLVWGKPEDVLTGVKEVAIRAAEALDGVPLETRQALPDDTTGFERILPGPDRMYPDTDLPPKPIESKRLEAAGKDLPIPPWEHEARYLRAGLSRSLAVGLSVSAFAQLYDKLCGKSGPRSAPELKVFLAWFLVEHLRALKRRGFNITKIDDTYITQVLRCYSAGRVTRKGLLKLIEINLQGREDDPETLIECCGLKPASKEEINKALDQAIKEGCLRHFGSNNDRVRWAMGHIMRTLESRTDGAQVRKCLEKALKLSKKRKGVLR